MKFEYENDEPVIFDGIDFLGKVGLAIWILNVALFLWK